MDDWAKMVQNVLIPYKLSFFYSICDAIRACFRNIAIELRS